MYVLDSAVDDIEEGQGVDEEVSLLPDAEREISEADKRKALEAEEAATKEHEESDRAVDDDDVIDTTDTSKWTFFIMWVIYYPCSLYSKNIKQKSSLKIVVFPLAIVGLFFFSQFNLQITLILLNNFCRFRKFYNHFKLD